MPDTLTAPPPAVPVAIRGTSRFGGATREISASAMPGNPNRQPRNPPAAAAPSPVPEPPPPPPTPPTPAAPRPGADDDRQSRAAMFAANKAGEPPTPTAASPPEPPADPNAAPPDPNVPQTEPAGTPAVDPKTGKPAKVSPWKLLDIEKKAHATAEAEVQRLKSSILPENDRTALTERVTKAEARAKELEDHIRYVDYSKSQEFIEKYDAPYRAAYNRAVDELGEIPVMDPQTQQPRAATAQDLQTLISLPLGEARALAKEVFGDFADDVMGHRKEIKALLDQRAHALDEARQNGELREKQRQEQRERQASQVNEFARTTFQNVNKQILDDATIGAFFKPFTPPEGQRPTAEEAEWNARLEKGFQLVDTYWAKHPMAPGLTEKQREDIIGKHAAIRLRAAAFGPMRYRIEALSAQVAALQKELKQYAASTPGAGGSIPPSNPAAPSDPGEARLQRAADYARRRSAH